MIKKYIVFYNLSNLETFLPKKTGQSARFEANLSEIRTMCYFISILGYKNHE